MKESIFVSTSIKNEDRKRVKLKGNAMAINSKKQDFFVFISKETSTNKEDSIAKLQRRFQTENTIQKEKETGRGRKIKKERE